MDTMEAIRDEPLRVVPKQTDLSNPLSEPLTESVATTSVVIAAADIDAEAVLLLGSVTVDVPHAPTSPPTDMATQPEGRDIETPVDPNSALDHEVMQAPTEESTVGQAQEHRYATRRSVPKDFKSMHTGRPAKDIGRHYGLHISVNKALNKVGHTALHSDETIQFHCKEVAISVRKCDLTSSQLQSVIRSSMFSRKNACQPVSLKSSRRERIKRINPSMRMSRHRQWLGLQSSQLWRSQRARSLRWLPLTLKGLCSMQTWGTVMCT